jgi:cysteine-rich repeat protein
LSLKRTFFTTGSLMAGSLVVGCPSFDELPLRAEPAPDSGDASSGGDSGASTGGTTGSGGAAGTTGSGGAAGSGGSAGADAGADTGAGVCGDDEVDPGEACDDANATTGDGCHRCRRVEQVANVHHGCVLIDDGTIKCWGYNYYGQLGAGDQAHRGDNPGEMGDNLRAVDLGPGRKARSIAVGTVDTCAVLRDGKLVCWGRNESGNELNTGVYENIGDEPNELGAALPVLNLGTGWQVKTVAMGETHGCAILNNDQLKCWPVYEPGRGWLVGDDIPFVNLGSGRTVRSVSSYGHTCALLDDSSVKCWGWNRAGQLGIGQRIDQRPADDADAGGVVPSVDLGAGRTAVAVVSGSEHTCAILNGGQVKCWGLNDFGQLGIGDTENRGDDPNEMGDALPAVDLGTGYTAKALALGTWHTCALLNNGGVKCWGNPFATGIGDATPRGDQPGEMGESLPLVKLGTRRSVRALSAGGANNCAVLDDYTVKCWGGNGSYGTLGLGDIQARGDSVDEMGDNLPTLLLP